MERNDSLLAIPIKDQSDLTWLLVEATESGLLQGATEMGVSQVKTILSELGTNIIKYAGRGVLSVKRIEVDGAIDILIRASDNGPGIPDIQLAMQDSFSTGSSLGLGLPSVRRLSDAFSLTSKPGQGTLVEVRKRIRAPQPRGSAMDRITAAIGARPLRAAAAKSLRSPQFDLGGYARPMPGELASGDLVHLQPMTDGLLIAVADVSGHGVKAADVAGQIAEHLASSAVSDLQRLMSDLHERLRGTLGAAVGLLYVNLKTAQVDFCAVGNVFAQRAVGEPWRPIAKDGVLGHRLPNQIHQSSPLRNGDLIIVCSDGISELAARNFAARHAHQAADKLAMELVLALGRPFDDASCAVFKWIA